MRNRTVLAGLAGLLSLFAFTPSPSWAQDRIPQSIAASSSRVQLQNTVLPKARAATDLGAASTGKTLETVSLRFNMTSAQSAALDQLLANQQNPASPQYHQWLTPEQFGAQFGMSENDLTAVTSWLTAQGLSVTGVARGRTFVNFSGTVGQVNQAFGVTLHNVSLNGEQHVANLTDPVLPASLANVVSTVTGLNDFRLKPRTHIRQVKPDFNGGSSYGNLIAPGDFYTIYDLKLLISNSINGAGITIAVTGQTDISQADYTAFRTAAGLSTSNPPVVQIAGKDPGTPSSSDFDEAMIDLEWSGATAPGANILYVTGPDIFNNSVTQAIDNKVAPIITTSYGDCESGFGNAAILSFNVLFKQANAQGQTMLGPAGDAGAADCETGQTTAATTGLSVDFPASSPYVTGVGATEFNENGGTYWTTTNGTNAGTALSYIPEQPWNETYLTTTAGALFGLQYGGSGGGGVSQLFSKPAWQVATGVPADASRDVPDIAFNGAADHDGYLVCASGDCTSGFASSTGSYDVYGGTSVSTPAFAGILALLEQKLQSTGLGNVNPNLYGLANSSYYSTVFHDVTSGNNAVPCSLGSTDCSTGYPGFNAASTVLCPANSCSGNIAYPSLGYAAGTGYDLTSGLGSIDVANLVNDWLLAPAVGVTTSTLVPSTLSVAASSTSITAGTSVTITASVASGGSSTTTPTGTATLLLDNAVIGSAVALSGGKVTFPAYATTSLASGPHSFAVSYSGDTVYAGSKGSLSVDVVSTTAADFSLTPATASVTVASGATTSGVTYTVAPLNGFTGNVSFSASTTSSTLDANYNFSVSPVVISGTTAGTTVFTLQAFVTNTGASTAFHSLGHQAALHPNPWALGGSGAVLAGLLLVTLPRRRRNRWSALMIALVSVGILSAAGCSGSQGTGTNGTTNTTPGTYPLTITAQGQNAAGTILTHSVNLTLVVQ